jgi:hypothetical protein
MRTAQEQFWNADRELLVNDANERSLCGRLAFLLVGLFPEFDVDIEYNRNHAERDYTKRIWDRAAIRALLESRGVADLAEREERAERDGLIVLPDIIVHIRDRPQNLLIIEAKKTSSRIPEDVDREKLRALRSDLQYRFAVLIRFPTGGATPQAMDGPDWFNLQ